jgi:hypothetical protein
MTESSSRILKALAVLAMVHGRGEVEKEVIQIYSADLAAYPESQVLSALTRCRQELRTFPTIADILARIDDQRPGAEEAWAMIPKDESGSVVWTDEMRDAFAISRSLFADDPVAARMAFREAYLKFVARARSDHRPTRWTPSLGHDGPSRAQALQFAVQRGHLSHEAAVGLLPDYSSPAQGNPQLPGPSEPEPNLKGFSAVMDTILANVPDSFRRRELIRRNVTRSYGNEIDSNFEEIERIKREQVAALTK